MEMVRNVVFQNFYGSGEHIYEDQLGFDDVIRHSLRSNVTKELFMTGIGECRYEMGFFYIDNGEFYFVARLEEPIEIRRFKRNPALSKYAWYQCEPQDYSQAEVLATFDTVEDIWNEFTIDGKSMEEIILHSLVYQFC